MQQRTEIIPYKRAENKGKNSLRKELVIDKEYLIYASVLICSFLISRVTFIKGYDNRYYYTSGIAIMIASILINRKNLSLIVLFGSIIGYLTLASDKLDTVVVFMAITVVIFLCDKLLNVKNTAVKLLINFIFFIAIMVPYDIIFENFSIATISIDILWKIASIIPIFAISYCAFYEMENKKNVTSLKYENLIVISLIAGFIVLGIGDFSIYGAKLANIIGLSILIILAFSLQSSAASLFGLIYGAIVGINTTSFIVYSGLYGITGFVINTFRNISKYIVAVLFFVGFLFLNALINNSTNITFIDIALATCIFLLVPQKQIKNILAKDEEKLDKPLEDAYLNELKTFYTSKIDNFSSVFRNMNKTIINMNKSIEENIKSDDQIIEEIIATRCNDCVLRNTCWKKNLAQTYNIFKNILQSYREQGSISIDEIERKCIDYNNLIGNFEKLISENMNYNIWSKRLNDNRTILADQMMNMSDSLKVMSEELEEGIIFRKDIENNIKNKFDENRINYLNITCISNSTGRIKINITLNDSNEILDNINSLNFIINEATKNNFYLSTKKDNNYKDEVLIFEETPRFHIVSSVKSIAKDGEDVSGDSYICEKIKSDKMVTIISDGVGSGKNAMTESKAAVDIMESFLKSGFNSITALTMINSIMSINFSQNEMFSTLDLSVVDLYSGEMEMAKLGASPTFIKNGSDVEFIHSKSLPMGIVDKINVDIIKKTLHNGDMIIMISDGALSSSDGKGNYAWLCNFLKKSIATDTQSLCNEIMDKIMETNEGKIIDDITVIVEKVFKIF
ncbi:MAG: stage II sporulation protein E [Oscillospiraceae bacterium]|nr:stage II sporulation protein E [Oscillospiraceae bacterium]